jgi:aldose 1-epimerase
LIPTGALPDLSGTPFDFRTPTTIGARINEEHEQLRFGGGYDHNWVLNQPAVAGTSVISVTEATSGRRLDVATTQPGVQFYTGNMLPDTLPGKGGQTYTKRTGFCLETQHFPDSPNQPHFPSTVLRPGEQFDETTIFTFGVS